MQQDQEVIQHQRCQQILAVLVVEVPVEVVEEQEIVVVMRCQRVSQVEQVQFNLSQAQCKQVVAVAAQVVLVVLDNLAQE